MPENSFSHSFIHSRDHVPGARDTAGNIHGPPIPAPVAPTFPREEWELIEIICA